MLRDEHSSSLMRGGDGTVDLAIPELAAMANVLNPEQTESITLNTEMDTLTLDAAAEQNEPSHRIHP